MILAKYIRLLPLLLVLLCLTEAATAQALTQYDLPPLPAQGYGITIEGGDAALFAADGMREPPSTGQSVSGTPIPYLYRLVENAEAWDAYPLEDDRAYAASVLGDNNGLYLIGGFVSGEPSRSAVLYRIDGDEVTSTGLPALPTALAFARAVIFDRKIWVIGGLTSMSPLQMSDSIFTLAIDDPDAVWQQTPSPLPARLLPSVSMQLGSIIVTGGWSRDPADKTGWVARNDLWRYRTEGSRSGTGWTELTAAPFPVGDADSACVGQSHLLFANLPAKGHADGFSKIMDVSRTNLPLVLAYNIITDSWFKLETLPALESRSRMTNWRVTERTGFKAMQKDVPVLFNFSEEGVHVSEIWVTPDSGSLGAYDYTLMVIYILVMVAIGLYYARKEKNSEDFFVGGRKIPWWAAAISAQATGASAITMMAIPALVYKESIVYFGANLFLGIIPVVFSAIFLIPIIRKLNIVSIYEYLEARFGKGIRLLGAGLYVISQVAGRMGVVVLLPALALSSVSGINVYVCIIVTGLVAMFYTTLGGISSVIWSDVVQFGIMLGGAILCVFLILSRIDGGLSTFLEVSTDYNKWQVFNFSLDFTLPIFWILLLMAPVTAFMSIGDQAFIQRISSVKDVKSAQKATLWNYLWALPLQCSMWLVGIALFVFYKHFPMKLDLTKATDTVFPQFISGQMPAGLSGLVVVGILAAAMSSLDSSMNSVSTVIITDFYRNFKKNPTERDCLKMARLMTVMTGLLGMGAAILIASLNLASAQETFSRLMSLMIGAFPAVFTLALLTRRANSFGAISALIGGFVIVYLVQTYTSVNWMLYPVIAFVFAMFVGYFASLLTGGNRKDLTGLTVWDMPPKGAPTSKCF